MSAVPSPPSRFRKGTLAALIGSTAAITVYTTTAMDESGRKVEVKLATDGTPAIRHVSGPQYLVAYKDIGSVATACDGIADGVKMGQRFTEAQCTTMLDRQLVIKAQGVMACSPALAQPGRDWQRVAAVTHAYQFGVGGWCTSTARKMIEQGKIAEGCAALLLWDKVRIKGKLTHVDAIAKRSGRRMEYCRTGLPGYPVETLPTRLKAWL